MEKTLSHILVVLTVSNACRDGGHFCSIDHSDDPYDRDNTAAAVAAAVGLEVVDYYFPTQAHDRNHGEVSKCANVD